MKRFVLPLLIMLGSLTITSSAADIVKFVSIPPLHGQVGVQYEYTAKAESNDSAATFTYYGGLYIQSVGTIVHVDSVSGKLEWTPTLRGIYLFHISAHSSLGGNVQQDFAVVVINGNGIIQGKVTDTLNAGIPNIIVEAFNTVNDSVLTFGYAARTDVNGNYRLSHVDPGSYKLRAASLSGKYESQWYDGKRNVVQADVISIADSPAVTIANFKLRGGNAIHPKVTVTGTVTDTLGAAISGANSRVVFVRAEFALNFGGGFSALEENFRKYFELNAHADFRLEGNSEFVFKAHPDSITGEYEIQLPAGRYIAFARARGYETEFYHESPDLLSADIFVAAPDWLTLQAPPNFTLAPLPQVALGSINGFVKEYNANGIPLPARVIAFRDRWRHTDQHRTARAYVTDTDSLGAYNVDELLPGTYVVMAVPLGAYSPSFYTGLDSADHRWKRAAKIEINGNSVDNINVYVKPLGPRANGYTSIYGNVSMSGDGSDGLVQGSLRAGALVYAAHDGWISGYAITGAGGNYTIAGLAPGEYTVFVDKPGFDESSTVEVSVGYSPEGEPISGTADFMLNSSGSATRAVSEQAQPAEYSLAQNYPNPFNPSTIISYSLPNAGRVVLTVHDLLGKEVATLVNGYRNKGTYNVTFNASNLSSGMYFYRLSAGSYKIVKKMVLTK